jgi:hypothetical protein
MKILIANTWTELAKDLEKYRDVKMYVSTGMRKTLQDVPHASAWLKKNIRPFLSKDIHIDTLHVLSVDSEMFNGTRKIAVVISLTKVDTNQDALFLLKKEELTK